MKTEQEQIEEIVKIILEASKKCFDADCDCCDNQYEKDCAQYRKAVALVQAGYGDISEYKADIERLEEKCEELRNEKWDVQDDIDCYCDEMPDKIKQAQVDVLNKAKERAVGLAAIETYHICNLIDKIIKEVQDE